jgi:FlaA1/EpsC-like NDP-sugar epimerase
MQNKLKSLMGREPARLDQTPIRTTIEGRVVLVTGAAGSIGAELCRQIARFSPAAIVGFEIAESPLFEIDREMRQAYPAVPFHAEVGNVQNRVRLDEIFRKYRPALVYHAAAYKHVPLMEENPFEAVENNVFGTLNVAHAANEHGASSFIFISSDKAVRPTSVMGATKRVSELLLESLQNGGTQFIAVRFGNVLDSQGSVVQIFRKQIASGGPVTVTHPEMRRYFMTIPEASQLVLQASTMGGGGEIFVLDMGDPVRIVDLARQLILLSGLKPDEDVRVEFTGLRPGEKLYEELNLADEQIIPTRHEKIRAFAGACMRFEQGIHHLAVLRHACEERDLRALIFELKDMVPDYNPGKDLLRQVLDHDLVRLGDALATPLAATPVMEV